ncbi:leucine-rich repeat domain-containing protein [Aquimarina algicola]|uniref:Leucine-rich repeat domain-containing protein n=1 Tax=Aquimarina algicola TaxID=2589995 RepID=A0A504IWQ3_9FLAO|nr:leucine-rich repeat domain-containing protein [Aquimarina algicola]TPN82907.1 leucine-rich repeat domain-containing protein [Aquimarina algicola]
MIPKCLVLLTILSMLSCQKEIINFEIVENPKILFNSEIPAFQTTLFGHKIGDTISVFDTKRLKNLDSLPLTYKIISYKKGYNFIINYGQIQSFRLNQEGLKDYKNIKKDSIEIVFGKADVKDELRDSYENELYATHFIYKKRNLMVSYDDNNNSIGYISIGDLPRPELLKANINSQKKITHLNLANQNYTSIPEEIKKFSNLRILNLSNNQLTNLPNWIRDFKKLEVLDLSTNKIKYLPNTIGELTNLSDIELHTNKLTKLPDSFCNLTNITWLAIYDNELQTLPDPIGNLSKLEGIVATNNKIKDLPISIGKLSKLKTVIFKNNLLQTMPKSINEWINIDRLDLRENPFTEVQKKEIRSMFPHKHILFSINSELLKNVKKDTIIKGDNTYHYIKGN